MRTKRSTTELEKDITKHFLYQVYIEEMQWDFSIENPSEIEIRKIDGKNVLCDKFDDISQWFCLDVEGRVEASCRLISGANIELKQFVNIPEKLRVERYVELNRFAVKAGDMSKFYKIKFMHDLLEICRMENIQRVFMGVNFPEPGEDYVRIGLKQVEESAFKYYKNDLQISYLTYFDLEDSVQVNAFKDFCTSLGIT